jgi:hypothetical protein
MIEWKPLYSYRIYTNSYLELDNCVVIKIRKYGKTLYHIYIDKIDLPLVLQNSLSPYAGRGKTYTCIYLQHKSYYLHRIILNASESQQVDHINRNIRDFRRNNLRLCTNAENKQNSPIQINNTSGTPGVFWQINKQKWYARVTLNGKNHNLGAFVEKEDAIGVVKEFRAKYMPFSNEARLQSI